MNKIIGCEGEDIEFCDGCEKIICLLDTDEAIPIFDNEEPIEIEQ